MTLPAVRITEIDGIPVMKIAPAADGGTIKNAGSERDVPIHPALIERGFLDFVVHRKNLRSEIARLVDFCGK